MAPDAVDFVHTGPETLAGRYLRRFWHPIHLSRALEPGRAVPIRVLGEDFTLFRGQSGTAQVLAHRCAHRGAQLSIGWVEGDHLRCRFHGWAYDATGQCIEQPAEPEPFCGKIRIASYRYGGAARPRLRLLRARAGAADPALAGARPAEPDGDDRDHALQLLPVRREHRRRRARRVRPSRCPAHRNREAIAGRGFLGCRRRRRRSG